MMGKYEKWNFYVRNPELCNTYDDEIRKAELVSIFLNVVFVLDRSVRR